MGGTPATQGTLPPCGELRNDVPNAALAQLQGHTLSCVTYRLSRHSSILFRSYSRARDLPCLQGVLTDDWQQPPIKLIQKKSEADRSVYHPNSIATC